jgi:hypothetical protein
MISMSRNARYEQAKRNKGLEKVALWVPASVAPNFKLAASLCVDNFDLTLTGLRSLKTGRFVSIERPVTGDAS